MQIRLIGQPQLLTATIWFNPKKIDYRIRNTTLRSAGSVDDILLVRTPPAGAKYDYEMEIVRQKDPKYASLLKKLTKRPPNSRKRYGYF